jgi:hypothetical protein
MDFSSEFGTSPSPVTTSIADMIGRIDEVVVDCANPKVLAQFWSAVLGGAPNARDEFWHYVDPPGWTRLAFQKVPEGKTVKNRLHLSPDADRPAVRDACQMGSGHLGVGWGVTDGLNLTRTRALLPVTKVRSPV